MWSYRIPLCTEWGKSKSNKFFRCPGSRYNWCAIENTCRVTKCCKQKRTEHTKTRRHKWHNQAGMTDERTQRLDDKQTPIVSQIKKIVSECTWVDVATMRKSVVVTTLNLIKWNEFDMNNSCGNDVLFVVILYFYILLCCWIVNCVKKRDEDVCVNKISKG